ncbi:MAG: hypothetical protein R3279_10290 [Putridiphycobacter sp.]|nr:hypothetical protein [Putridiphycobacter sp.]
MRYLSVLIFFYASISVAKAPVVYSLNWYDLSNGGKDVYFFSVSDQYTISEHPDSAAMPSHYFSDHHKVQDYYILKGNYRQRCLNALHIDENDVAFVYDYQNDKLLRFYIRGLKLIAVLSPYSTGSHYPISQYDYMIGFEIDPIYFTASQNYFSQTLITIGKTNPFTRGQMQPIVWQSIDPSYFPTEVLDSAAVAKAIGEAAETFYFPIQDLTVYVQIKALAGETHGFHVKAVESNGHKIKFDHFYRDTEGASIAYLNGVNPDYSGVDIQYTGQLFKDYPLVVFGFLYHSFGCPAIAFLEPSIEPLYINCDNRH